jgi:transposase
MARQRKTYTAEFKLNAVRLVTDRRLSVAEAARQLGICENLLRVWKRTFLDHGIEAFPGHGHVSRADGELRRLRAEVVRLRAERDLLKKAAAYFASPPT